MNFFTKNLFSKWEHIRTKLRIYSDLLNKSLTKNFISCLVNIIGFTPESCKVFFKPNCQSLKYFTSINIWRRLVSSFLFRNQLLACSKGLVLLQTSIGWRSPSKLVGKLLTKAAFRYYKKGYFTVKGDLLLMKTRYVVSL